MRNNTQMYAVLGALCFCSWSADKNPEIPVSLPKISQQFYDIIERKNEAATFSTWPVQGYATNVITNCFRYGVDWHYAVDIRGKRDDDAKVVSVGGGKVIYVDHTDAGEVQIDHGWNIASGYVHLEDILVTEGQQVTAGTYLGKPGGRWDADPTAFPDHLHFSVYKRNESVNPLCFFSDAVSFTAKEGACNNGLDFFQYCDIIK